MESVKLEQPSQNTLRKRYDPEFIQQVLGVYQSGVYATIEDCAIAYNIPKKTLGGWIAKYKKNSSPDIVVQQQAEISNLKKELAKAKMELEILKKASIYFASQVQ
ncbi:MAG: hypothetical protein QG570_764 [Patescibacteria group bacterium]|nr:hypothetical protein [Patescibacteria group bacterium]